MERNKSAMLQWESNLHGRLLKQTLVNKTDPDPAYVTDDTCNNPMHLAFIEERKQNKN